MLSKGTLGVDVAVSDADIAASLVVLDPNGEIWRAFVVRDEMKNQWRLYVENRGVSVLAGAYEKGEVVAALARRHVRDKFGPNVRPQVDTFDQIVGRNAESVIPVCFNDAARRLGQKHCGYCPFRSQCCAEVEAFVPVEQDLEEPNEVLMARLREKVAKMYGGGGAT